MQQTLVLLDPLQLLALAGCKRVIACRENVSHLGLWAAHALELKEQGRSIGLGRVGPEKLPVILVEPQTGAACATARLDFRASLRRPPLPAPSIACAF